MMSYLVLDLHRGAVRTDGQDGYQKELSNHLLTDYGLIDGYSEQNLEKSKII